MKRCISRKGCGLMLLSFGLGIILALLLPLWGWRFLVGCSFVVAGWWWFFKCK